ncbi:MAG: aldo/keto reductase [Syntrophorhabdales bacterium]|jgi:aryl-alcohol dehydrogenase-like predicted oxidoreductase
MELKTRPLGRTDVRTTILGLGGEGVLRTTGHGKEAYRVINRALDLGITYCESARAYAGSEEYYGLALRERRKEIFLTSKSHARDKRGAEGHLATTLRNMKTDYLDLWQVHDVRTEEEIREIFGPGGAIEAFAAAKEQGSIRFVGVTGHHDPRITLRCLDLFPFDTVLLPVNPGEALSDGFVKTVIPAATKKGMGIIGMKVYFRGLAARLPWYDGMEPFFRFALSQGLTLAVIGADTVEQIEENVAFARAYTTMAPDEQEVLVQAVSPYARELMYYRP